jgi:hypothetical protein
MFTLSGKSSRTSVWGDRDADGIQIVCDLGRLRAAVADVVARQRDASIDLVNDGEFGHSMGMNVNYLPFRANGSPQNPDGVAGPLRPRLVARACQPG